MESATLPASEGKKLIRVLIVEDSLTERAFLKSILESDPDIEVIGVAGNGNEAVTAAAELQPDLVTMDIQLPGMNGIEATRRIMQESPTRIVIFSRGVDLGGEDGAFHALNAGALDVLEKPTGMGIGQLTKLREQLIHTIKLMSVVKVVRRRPPREPRAEAAPPAAKPSPMPPTGRVSMVAIGASTGGPAALNTILSGLPADFPVPVIVVQHISTGFTANMVDWLRKQCALPIHIAHAHQRMQPGQVYFAPEDIHLVVTSRHTLGFRHGPLVSAVRPSATVLFRSIARIYGADAGGVLLTGIGDDGAIGLKAMHEAGAPTIGQDEATSVVYGMPKAAAELGAVDAVLPIDEIAPAIVKLAAVPG
ncbi:MAG TPA: chemotaxis-specific protein-glutamate methyltransferase CheB [Actinomycetota bacterium]|nr:chemotaxis-specific protein-glutamate methyltransferase CheB [Actinomycetota bacterium]